MATQEPTIVAKHLIQVSRTANEKKKLYLKQHKITELDITQEDLAEHKNALSSMRKPILDEIDALSQVQVDQIHAMVIFGRSGTATEKGSLKVLYDDFTDEKKNNSRVDYRQFLKQIASNLDGYLENCIAVCERIPTDPDEELC